MKNLEWCSLRGGQNHSSPETPPPSTQFVPWAAHRHRSPRPPFAPEESSESPTRWCAHSLAFPASEYPMTGDCDPHPEGPTDPDGTYDVESQIPRPRSPHRRANTSTVPPKTCPGGGTGPSTLDQRPRPLPREPCVFCTHGPTSRSTNTG